jgi:hypothetical protein
LLSANATSTQTVTELTLEAWAEPIVYDSYLVGVAGTTSRLYVKCGSQGTDCDAICDLGPVARLNDVPLGTHHYVCRGTANATELFIDDTLVDTGSASSQYHLKQLADIEARVGTRYAGTPNVTVDEAAVYDRALTNAEIAEHYAAR